MSEEEERFERIERAYLAPPNREVVAEMMREFSENPGASSEFEEWVYFENGKQVTVRRSR